MDIKYIKKSELDEYSVQSAEFYDDDIPITHSRAVSQSHNPYAGADDIVLITASEGNKLLSYIGILPGIIRGDRKQKIYWNSCWWAALDASPALSVALLKEFIAVTKQNFALSDISEDNVEIFKFLGYQVNEREGVLVRFKSAFHARSLRKSIRGKAAKWINLMRNSGLFRMTDYFLNLVFPKHLGDRKILRDTEGELEIANNADKAMLAFIREHSIDRFCIPDEAYFNWLFSDNWLVKPDNLSKTLAPRYYFSSLSSNFNYRFLKLTIEGKLRGLALLSQNDGVVKTLYIWCDPIYKTVFFRHIINYLDKLKTAHTLITAEQHFIEFLKENLNKNISLKSFKRFTCISNSEYQNYRIEDGDGDYSFW